MAMVNVDFSSPSFVLGAVLVGIAVTLLQLRKMSTRLSQDADIVVAAVVSVVGATLIFQGWRLDPLLLLSQTLTTGVAVFYGAEAFMLRGKAATETPLQQQQQPGEGERRPETLGDLFPAQQQAVGQQQQQQPGYGGQVGGYNGAAGGGYGWPRQQQQQAMPPGMAASWQQQQQPFNYPPPGSLYSQQGPYSQGASPPPAGVYAGGWPQGLPPGSTVSWQESLGMGPAPVNSQQPPAADFYSNPSPMMGPAPGYAEYMEAAAPLPAQGGGGGGGYSDNGPPQAATGWAASPQALDDAPYGYGTSSYSPPAGTPDMNVSGSYYPPPSTAGYFGPGDSRVPPLPPAVKALPPVERIEDWDD